MKIRAFALLLAIFSLLSRAQAGIIEWNQMRSVYGEDMDSGPIWHVLGANFDRHVYFEFWLDADFRATVLNNEPNNFSTWVRQMSHGEVVDAESMRGEGLTYFYHAEKGRSGIDSDYAVAPNSYLAICVEAGAPRDPFYAYGWVELGWDENGYPPGPVVLASAWDADGGPMIVGGGSALIPEPSAALLLLVGGALLALRRQSPISDCIVGIKRLAKTGNPPDTLSGESCARQSEYLVYYPPSGACPAFYDKL